MEQTQATPTASPSKRVISIDVFRGFTILAMIFVNDLGHVKGVPWWLKHIPSAEFGMTLVDVVFPAFLFIVGIAIPFAINRRLERGHSFLQVWQHIIIRTLGLLIIGVFMVNMYGYNAQAAALSSHLWVFLMFLGVILVWNDYPKSEGRKQPLYMALRLAGIALLIVMAIFYRGGKGEDVIWMRTSWWGILGLIGWAYITCCAAYLLFRKHIAGMVGFLGIMIALYLGDAAGALDNLFLIKSIKKHLWLGGQIGGHSSITAAGVIVGMLFLPKSPVKTPTKRFIWVLTFALGLFIAGYLLKPLHDIHKNKATPTWCLYSSAICCIIYAFLYWLMDLRGITRWASFVKPCGANPLLAYILPDIFYAVLGILGIELLKKHFNVGFVGIMRSLVFSLFMVGLTDAFYRLRVRLRL